MKIIEKYFPDISQTRLKQFHELDKLYAYWNERINVISRKDLKNLYERHILHSLAISKIIQFKAGTKILDVGSGGGFPGIPLAIMFPDSHFHLVDSIQKKIRVIKTVSSHIGLNNLSCEHIRAEKVKNSYDFITARAVTRLSVFYKWVGKIIKPRSINELQNGILYLKGGDLSEELKPFNDYQLFQISDFFEESFFQEKKVVYLPFQHPS